MSNFLDTVTVGDKVAIYDNRTDNYTLAEIAEVFETQVYLKDSRYGEHIPFKKSDGKSIDKTNQWITLCAVTKEMVEELAEAQRKSESKARKAKLIALLNDDAVSVDSDNTFEKCWETIIGY